MANDDVIFKFRDQGSIYGIPARDLTQEDFDKLSLLKQRDVQSGKLYEAVGPVEELPANTAPDFESMTKAQLQDYAAEHDIEVDGSATKAEMIATIQGGGE